MNEQYFLMSLGPSFEMEKGYYGAQEKNGPFGISLPHVKGEWRGNSPECAVEEP